MVTGHGLADRFGDGPPERDQVQVTVGRVVEGLGGRGHGGAGEEGARVEKVVFWCSWLCYSFSPSPFIAIVITSYQYLRERERVKHDCSGNTSTTDDYVMLPLMIFTAGNEGI